MKMVTLTVKFNLMLPEIVETNTVFLIEKVENTIKQYKIYLKNDSLTVLLKNDIKHRKTGKKISINQLRKYMFSGVQKDV